MLLMAALPLMAMAQDNTWEQAEKTTANGNPDQKYLAGAVPEVDGKVVFETTIKAPGKSRKQVYDIVMGYMNKLVKEPNQLEQSRILLTDSTGHLIAECNDGEATIKMTRIFYLYDEERDPQTYKAEEWINDRYGLNRKQTKLARVSGKFRRKTIDRKDYLFNKFEQLLNQ